MPSFQHFAVAAGNELRHRLWSDIIWEERTTALSLLVFKSGSHALPIEQPTVAQAGVLLVLLDGGLHLVRFVS